MIKYIFSLCLLPLTSYATVDCAVSHNQYFPQISVDVVKSAKKGLSHFSYRVGVSKDSNGAIHAINLFTDSKLTELNNKNSVWQFGPKNNYYQASGVLGKKKYIQAGNTVPAFSFEGSSHYGIVPVKFVHDVSFHNKLGRYSLTANTTTPCPGFYQVGSTAVKDPWVRSIAIAPIPESQSSAISLIDNEGVWTGSVFQNMNLVEISPLDEGTKEILILGSKDLKVKDIDLSSLKISRGEAKVKSFEIIKANAVNNIDPLSMIKTEQDNLKISFDLQQANILCEIDHAILIQGKTKKGKEFLTGVRIKPVICDLKTFAKEIPKIRKELDAHERDNK